LDYDRSYDRNAVIVLATVCKAYPSVQKFR